MSAAIDPFFLDTLVKVLFVIYFALLIVIVGKNVLRFKRNAGKWTDENVHSGIAMMLAFACIALFLVVKIDFTNLPETRPWFIIVPITLIVVPPGLLFASIITTAIQKKRGIPKVRRFGTEVALMEGVSEKTLQQLNFSRKIFHGIIFAAIVTVIFIVAPYATDYGYQHFWGNWTGMGLLTWWTNNPPFSVAQGIIIVIFYGFAWGTMATENTRISDTYQFPFLKSIQTKLRAKEMDTYASYVYFFVGFLFAALFLPPTLLLGTFALFTFGDTMASSVGIRYGKHKIPINAPKSWEGVFGGFVASFLAGILFVGFVWSLAGALLFVLIDVFTPKPFRVSDNILIPLAVPFLYWGLAVLGIPATCYFLPLLT
ncbi:MAG TPA: hypothetical protein VKK79_11580 [Candidatus Lokiarchaeia archaeon]|nr:hypothetical protein [Candidatus Lokiarchaeia archaeon]